MERVGAHREKEWRPRWGLPSMEVAYKTTEHAKANKNVLDNIGLGTEKCAGRGLGWHYRSE